MRINRTVALWLAVLVPVAAAAADEAASPNGMPTKLHYVAYAAGFRVLDLQVDLTVSDADYRVGMTLKTAGFFGAVVSGVTTTQVQGAWSGMAAMPRRYDSHGVWRGQSLRSVIDYLPAGPRVIDLAPDPDPDGRDPVPPAQQVGTVDALSGMAALIRQVARNGSCDNQMRLFDGRRLSVVRSRTAGTQVLEPTSRSVFHGPALRCDFEGRQLAGFPRDEDRERLAKPHAGTAWFAPIDPGGMPLPVRVVFETRFFGHATMYLAPES